MYVLRQSPCPELGQVNVEGIANSQKAKRLSTVDGKGQGVDGECKLTAYVWFLAYEFYKRAAP